MRPKRYFPKHRREQPACQKSWWAKLWDSRAAWAGAFALVGAVIAFILTQGVASLQNARKLPSEISETYNALMSWHYDDKAWTGTWSSREEGDIEDYHPSDLPLKLGVDTTTGKVAGEMFNRRVCDLNPMLPPVFVEGEIHGGKLLAYAYAYVGGKKTTLYSFSATKSENDPVITLAPLSDPLELMPPYARLVKRFHNDRPSTNENAADSEHPDLSCPESPTDYLQRLRREGKLKGVEELGIARERKNTQK